MSSVSKSYPVSRYLQSVHRLIHEKIPAVWVHGVISQMVLRAPMCYISLAEYAEGDVRPTASLSLVLFQKELDLLQAKLERLPQPFRLEQDLKVSLLVQADFYVPQGRFQAKVLDIDPMHTLGEQAVTKQAILKRLENERLLHRNQEHPFPSLPLRIGLITAPQSAAYQDFIKTLQSSDWAFDVVPVWARMQGKETENTVLNALGELIRDDSLDVICLIRGGGGKTDLTYFDSEAICRAIALAPLPVLTGIGHEIDQSLADLVSWKSCITPTDTAKWLIAQVDSAWTHCLHQVRRVAQKVQRRLVMEQRLLSRQTVRIGQSAPVRISREREKHYQLMRELQRSLKHRLTLERATLVRNHQGLQRGAQKILKMEQMQLGLMSEKVSNRDPKNLLARGWSLLYTDQNQILCSTQQVTPGMHLRVQMSDGEIPVQVQDKMLP